MIRFFDRNFSEKLIISSVLDKLFGINQSSAFRVCALAKVAPQIALKFLPVFKLREIENIVYENFIIERPLRKEYLSNIERKIKKGIYVGIRLQQNLPSRGQRTRTNARTSKNLKKFNLK